MGDFNAITNFYDKILGSNVMDSKVIDFKNCVLDMGITELATGAEKHPEQWYDFQQN